MNVLFRFYDIQKGDVKIDGTSIYDMSRQDVRQHMGIVLQDPYLFSGTIASNVNLDHEAVTREQIEAALKQVGADKLLAHLPKGFDEPVIEKGSTLSSGERQLISFARALAYDPAILVLDEATANIDTETEAVIQKALDVVKKAARPLSSHTGYRPSERQIKSLCLIRGGSLKRAHMRSL